MPNTSAAKKALRVSVRKKATNDKRRIDIRNARRVLNKLFAMESKPKEQDFLDPVKEYYSALDKGVKGSIIPRNKSARLKSRMMKKIKTFFDK